MTIAQRSIVSFDGHAINDGTTYEADFEINDGGVFDTLAVTAVETDRVGNTPNHVRVQPQATDFAITIVIVDMTQNNYDQLKKWFNPKGGQRYLTATDGNSVSQRILCSVNKLSGGFEESTNLFKVTLRAVSGWEAVSASTGGRTVTASGQNWTDTNSGDDVAYPTITVTPGTTKTHGNDWIKRRRIAIAQRSEFPLTDPVGDGYPIEVTDGGIDTSTLNGASKIQADLDDLRVILNSEEQNAWLSPDGTVDIATKVWVNLQYRPMKKATLAADINAGASSLTVDNAEGLGGWPLNGFFLIDSECIQYSSRTAFSPGTLTRGARHTTAASHSAGAVLYWVEHPYLDLIYDYTAATDPAPPDDRKPLLDLSLSTNARHVWPGAFFNDNDLRSRAWQRVYTDDGASSQHLRLYDSSGQMLFEDTLPSAGKPRFNNAVMDFPIPVKATTDALSFDFDVPANLLFQAFVLDIDGNESRLFTRFYTAGLLTAQTYSPGDVLARVRLNCRLGAILGNLTVSTAPQSLTRDTNSLTSFPYNDSYGAAQTANVTVYLCFGIRFRLDADTEVNRIIVNGDSGGGTKTLTCDIYTANGLVLGDFVLTASFTLTGSQATVLAAYGEDLTLPADDYIVVCNVDGVCDGAELFGGGRIEPEVFGCIEPSVWPLTITDSHGVVVAYDVTGFHQPLATFSPFFAIVSRTAEPQADAPLQTGAQLLADNIDVLLDDDTPRTPKIILGDEEVLYLLNARIENTTTGDYLDLFFPMALSQAIQIDCLNRQILDLETGLPIPFALTASNPDQWLTLEPGANVFSYTEVGVVSTAVATSWRNAYL